MSSIVAPTLLVAALASVACLGCPVPTPPRDVATAERCDDLPADPGLGALYTGSITRVERVEATSRAGGATATRLEGAAIRLNDVRVDDALLARALSCHAGRAHIPSVSNVAPNVDPLRPHGGEVRVAVDRTDHDVVVRVTSRNDEVAAEVLHRATMLADRARERSRRMASGR